MAYYPHAQELGARYVLTSADGVTAVFNDPNDPNYVGMLTDVTGLDSADVREAADNLVEADGGQHGYFWLGRRPITLSGRVFGHATALARRQRLDLARRASYALRTDSTLSWRPANRRENLVPNPSFEINTSTWTLGNSAGITTPAFARSTVTATVGTASGQVSGNQPADTTARGIWITSPTGTSAMPVKPGVSYYATATANHVDAPGQGSRVIILWWKSDGSASATASTAGTAVGAGSNTVVTPNVTATAPADAAYASVRLESDTATASDAIIVRWDAVMFTETAMGTTYFDGDTAGFYWQGNQGLSASGDFVEQYTPVRRQQPWRESGAWVKDFQIALVSQYAPIFSTTQKSVAANLAAGASVENRGNYAGYPVVNIAGGALANPTVTRTGGEVFSMNGTGLTIASGETVQVDFLNHTATFIAGARNGQSANRYINFGTTQWPSLPTGTSTLTLGGTGTGSMTVLWRDTWA